MGSAKIALYTLFWLIQSHKESQTAMQLIWQLKQKLLCSSTFLSWYYPLSSQNLPFLNSFPL